MYLLALSHDRKMRTTTRLFNGGKVTVPAQIRRAFDIEDGDLVEIDVQPVKFSGRNTHD